jgi:hypothetical protein
VVGWNDGMTSIGFGCQLDARPKSYLIGSEKVAPISNYLLLYTGFLNNVFEMLCWWMDFR